MDAFFEGTPLQKWQEIIHNASPTLVSLELESLLERIAIYEMLLHKQGIDAQLALEQSRFDESILVELEEMKNNLAIDSMAKILSNHE
ncbi:DUF2018 family protein [Helicobacter mastomyrinus]|uniref:DUF2018 family protein n=1 Tax=Helicobacter mastomyrinus TaxID=287948 RepID=A0ABZ3F6Q6_9HELI|nr:DUF2018 family protein [uncultured Helicobacter sp.]